MCGIFYQINRRKEDNFLNSDTKLNNFFKCRGPNHCHRVTYKRKDSNDVLTFVCSILWMQGKSMGFQPLENNNGILIYNGDNFDRSWYSESSDTEQLWDKINNKDVCKVNVIKSLTGPFSIIFYDKLDDILYFSRDSLGRNSLLMHLTDDGFMLSSVLTRKYDPCIEVPTNGIFAYNFNTNTIKCCSWNENIFCKEIDLDIWFKMIKIEQCKDLVFCEINEEIVTNENDENLINYIEAAAKEFKDKKFVMAKLLENQQIKETVDNLIKLLKNSINVRLERQPGRCKKCLISNEKCKNHCSVSILFSGGLDCTILALLCSDFLPEDETIELLNVAFDVNSAGTFDVPDRLTGRQSYLELRMLRPKRNWCFKEINVGTNELKKMQSSIIADLVFPRNTILDESLGSALWFAARGVVDGEESNSRLVLIGSGADELFGGYTRHRKALVHQSWGGLYSELMLDWLRLPYRNLARDNRVISHHGRQARMPYLDEEFTNYVLNLKPWMKCIPNDVCKQGLGDKLILRLVSYKLGLVNVATLPKRALQFGSRIAKKKENGHNISERFKI